MGLMNNLFGSVVKSIYSFIAGFSMGVTASKRDNMFTPSSAIDSTNKNHTTLVTKSCFMFNSLIGEGGFGKVYSAMFMRNRNWLAMKDINKHALLSVNPLL